MGERLILRPVTKGVRTYARRVLESRGYTITRTQNRVPLGEVTRFCAEIKSRGFEPVHILDVGANRGEWSRAAKQVFPDSAYTLIEPQVEMAEPLDAFCAETDRARWLNVGAAAVTGELDLALFAEDQEGVSSTFAIDSATAKEWHLTQRRVPVMSLDDLCAGLTDPLPDMVKLDVEGFEWEVLKGAQTLVGHTELFLVELTFFQPHPRAKTFTEMVAIMGELGYRPYDFTSIIPRPYDGAPGLCEMAFAKDGGRLRSTLRWA